MSTYLVRRGEVETTVRYERWLGGEPRALYRGPDDPSAVADLIVGDVALRIDPLEGIDLDTASHTLTIALTERRYREFSLESVAQLLAPEAAIAEPVVDDGRVAGVAYRLGIDDGQPGDVWFEIGWDADLGSFTAMQWQRDVNGDIDDVPERWIGHRAGELPNLDRLQAALGFRLPPGLTAELDADRSAFDLDGPFPGFDESAFAELLQDEGAYPRYTVRAEGSCTVIERLDWDGADPFRVGAGEWSPITTLVRIDSDREEPAQPTPGTRAQWMRLNDIAAAPDTAGSWRVAFDPDRDGFVACHVEELADGTERVTTSVGDDATLTTVDRLAAAIGRDVPSALRTRLEAEQIVFGPAPDPQLSSATLRSPSAVAPPSAEPAPGFDL